MLEGKSKLIKPQKAKSLYVLIPSSVAGYSTFPLREGSTVSVTIEGNAVVIRDTCSFEAKLVVTEEKK